MSGNERKKSLVVVGITSLVCICVSAIAWGADVEAVRRLTFAPGQTFDVTIEVTVAPGVTVYSIIVKEAVPAAWSILSAQPESNTPLPANEAKWLFYSGGNVGSKTIRYTLQVPSNAQLGDFHGEVVYADAQDNIHTIPIITMEERVISQDLVVLDVEVATDFQTTGVVEVLLSPLLIERGQAKRGAFKPLAATDIDVLSVQVLPSEYSANADVVTQGAARKPMALVMDFDSSGSLGSNDPSRLRVDAGQALVNNLQADDRAAVFDFGTDASLGGFVTVRRLSSLTANKEKLSACLANLTADGGTPLYESLLDVLHYATSHTDPETYDRAVVLFSDGQPNDHNAEQAAIRMAKASGIPILTVGLGPASTRGSDAAETLRTLSAETNGIFSPIASSSDLETVFSQIAQGLTAERQILRLQLTPVPPPGIEITVTVRTSAGDVHFSFTAPTAGSILISGTVTNKTNVQTGTLVVTAESILPGEPHFRRDGVPGYQNLTPPAPGESVDFQIPDLTGTRFTDFFVVAFMDTNGNGAWDPRRNEPCGILYTSVRRGSSDVRIDLELPSDKAKQAVFDALADLKDEWAACGLDILSMVPLAGGAGELIAGSKVGYHVSQGEYGEAALTLSLDLAKVLAKETGKALLKIVTLVVEGVIAAKSCSDAGHETLEAILRREVSNWCRLPGVFETCLGKGLSEIAKDDEVALQYFSSLYIVSIQSSNELILPPLEINAPNYELLEQLGEVTPGTPVHLDLGEHHLIAYDPDVAPGSFVISSDTDQTISMDVFVPSGQGAGKRARRAQANPASIATVYSFRDITLNAGDEIVGILGGRSRPSLTIDETGDGIADRIISPIDQQEIVVENGQTTGKGDVNGDGNISPADAQLAYEIWAGSRSATTTERQAADYNGDGSVTPADAQAIYEAWTRGERP